VTLPEEICLLPGDNRAWCGRHGWSLIVRRATAFDMLGIPEPENKYPDNPLF